MNTREAWQLLFEETLGGSEKTCRAVPPDSSTSFVLGEGALCNHN